MPPDYLKFNGWLRNDWKIWQFVCMDDTEELCRRRLAEIVEDMYLLGAAEYPLTTVVLPEGENPTFSFP